MDANIIIIPNSKDQIGLRAGKYEVLGIVKTYVYKDINNLWIILQAPSYWMCHLSFSSTSSSSSF